MSIERKQPEYSPLPKNVTQRILRKWKSYKELFGLEGDIILEKGTDDAEKERKIHDRKINVASLLEDWKRTP